VALPEKPTPGAADSSAGVTVQLSVPDPPLRSESICGTVTPPVLIRVAHLPGNSFEKVAPEPTVTLRDRHVDAAHWRVRNYTCPCRFPPPGFRGHDA